MQVDKILGPGNQYVTAAKMLLQNSEAMVSIDMPAGPSEVLVIADAQAPHAHVAADLLSQAEHGPDSQVMFVAAVTHACTGQDDQASPLIILRNACDTGQRPPPASCLSAWRFNAHARSDFAQGCCCCPILTCP